MSISVRPVSFLRASTSKHFGSFFLKNSSPTPRICCATSANCVWSRLCWFHAELEGTYGDHMMASDKTGLNVYIRHVNMSASYRGHISSCILIRSFHMHPPTSHQLFGYLASAGPSETPPKIGSWTSILFYSSLMGTSVGWPKYHHFDPMGSKSEPATRI